MSEETKSADLSRIRRKRDPNRSQTKLSWKEEQLAKSEAFLNRQTEKRPIRRSKFYSSQQKDIQELERKRLIALGWTHAITLHFPLIAENSCGAQTPFNKRDVEMGKQLVGELFKQLDRKLFE